MTDKQKAKLAKLQKSEADLVTEINSVKKLVSEAKNASEKKGHEKSLSDLYAKHNRAYEELMDYRGELASANNPPASSPPAQETKDGAVTIAAKTGGYRRAGMAHPAEQTEHAAGTFSDKQLKALEADPNLVVVRH